MLQDDGTRSTDRAFQGAIDDTLEALLLEAGIPFEQFTDLDAAVERARLVSGRLPLA